MSWLARSSPAAADELRDNQDAQILDAQICHIFYIFGLRSLKGNEWENVQMTFLI